VLLSKKSRQNSTSGTCRQLGICHGASYLGTRNINEDCRGKTMNFADKLIESCSNYMTSEEVSLVRRATELAKMSFGASLTRAGDPYFNLVFEIANELALCRLPSKAVMASIASEMIEDMGENDLDPSVFGSEVLQLAEAASRSETLLSYLAAKQIPAHTVAESVVHVVPEDDVLRILCSEWLVRSRRFRDSDRAEYRQKAAWLAYTCIAPICDLVGQDDWARQIRTSSSPFLPERLVKQAIPKIEFARREALGNVKHDEIIDFFQDSDVITNQNSIRLNDLTGDESKSRGRHLDDPTMPSGDRYDLSEFFHASPSPGYRKPSPERAAEIAAAPEYKKYLAQAETKFRCEPRLMDIIKLEASRRGVSVNAFLRAAVLNDLNRDTEPKPASGSIAHVTDSRKPGP